MTMPDGSDTAERARKGAAAAIVGIFVNLLLFGGKLAAGILFRSSAMTADAFNNLTDAGTSLISLVSFRISSKPADRGHPFGHARVEYVAGMVGSILILVVGFQLLRDAVSAILTPEETNTSPVAILILAAAIAAKLLLALYYRIRQKRIQSPVLLAAALDSLTDALSTSAVLASTLIAGATQWYRADGIVGACVSCLILWSGVKLFRETMNSLLGEAPSPELIEQIKAVVFGYPDALGIHDLMIHNYGPGHIVASLHVEVDGRQNIFHSHDVVDNIERTIRDELGIECTVHMDPIVVGDASVDRLRQGVLAAVQSIHPALKIHDFRVVTGTTHNNLIFDVEVPFEVKIPDAELSARIRDAVHQIDPKHETVITIDRE